MNSSRAARARAGGLDTPDIANEELRRAVSSLQSVVFGAPHFFRPRWFEPIIPLLSFR